MWYSLFCLLSSISTLSVGEPLTLRVQESRPVKTEPVRAEEELTEPALTEEEVLKRFKNLDAQYQVVLKSYAQRLRWRRRDDEPLEEDPKHPAVHYYPGFRELGDAGHLPAMLWIASNVHVAGLEDESCQEVTAWVYSRVAFDFGADPRVLMVADQIPDHVDDLGYELAVELCEALLDASPVPEIQARAMLGKFLVLQQHEESLGREPSRETVEVLWDIVRGFVGTDSGIRASMNLHDITSLELLGEMEAWMSEIEALQAKGVAVEEWPPGPMDEYVGPYQEIAAAGCLDAAQYANDLHPHWSLARDEAPALPFKVLSDELFSVYSAGAAWRPLWWRNTHLILKAFAHEPWFMDYLGRLVQFARPFEYDKHIEAQELLLARSGDDPELRATALSHIGRLNSKCFEFDKQERAVAIFEQLMEEFPDHQLARMAKIERDALERLWPGKTVPDFQAVDQTGAAFRIEDYRGKPTLVTIGHISRPVMGEVLQQAAELRSSYESALEVLSVVIAKGPPRQIQRMAQRAGLDWRYTRQLSDQGPILVGWGLRSFPVYVLIDGSGVVRARNLPWPEMKRQVDQLIRR